MGDRVVYAKPDGMDERKEKRKKREASKAELEAGLPAKRGRGGGGMGGNGGMSVLELDTAGLYRPRTKETRAAYEALLNAIHATFGDQPADVLRGAAERMQALVHGTRLREAMASESPLQPEHLSFAAAGGARHICEDSATDGNDGDSVGSLADLEVPAAESEEDQEREEHEQVRVHIDPRAPAALDDGIAGDDAFLPDWLRPREFAGFEVEAAEYAQSEADGARDPRMGAWARDDVGLAQDGRRMYCDYHDLRGTCPHACMAADMLQQSRIAALVQKHERLRARRSQKDPDGREARHALYKAVIAWQWANPLGAENRVRLPRCVEHCVRRRFPNPICGEGCDYS